MGFLAALVRCSVGQAGSSDLAGPSDTGETAEGIVAYFYQRAKDDADGESGPLLPGGRNFPVCLSTRD